MTVITYSLKKDRNDFAYCGSKKRCKHFKVSEFASPDGADKVLIDTTLIAKLEQMREYYNGGIHITSGYRSPAYNKRIGGYKYSHHAMGKAADIVVYNSAGKIVPPKEIMLYLWRTGWKEGGIMSTATHMGVREDRYFMEERGQTTSLGYPQIQDVPYYFGMVYKTDHNAPVYNGKVKTGKINKGTKFYCESVTKRNGKTWGKIKNGKTVLIKRVGKVYASKI